MPVKLVLGWHFKFYILVIVIPLCKCYEKNNYLCYISGEISEVKQKMNRKFVRGKR